MHEGICFLTFNRDEEDEYLPPSLEVIVKMKGQVGVGVRKEKIIGS